MPHIHEKIDFTVEVFIVYNNKVLLRKHDKYDIWLSVGGHIELNENPNEAAIREVKEEVGIDIELYKEKDQPLFKRDDYGELIPPQFMNIYKINDTHKHITLVYFAISSTDKIIQSTREESEELKWFSSEELKDGKFGIRDEIRNYAQTALNKLSN